MMHAAWAALLAAACAAVGDRINRRVVGWLPDDPPRPGRKQHARPVPLAGVVLLPALVPWWVANGAWLPLLAVLLAAATGFVDDRQKERGDGIDWRWKAMGLAAAAAAAAASLHSPLDEPRAFALAAAFVFVLINATNFLDNMDGVAIALSAASLLLHPGGDPLAAAAAFAALGFLPWNWPRPRLFLGDSGAYALGTTVGLVYAPALAHGALGLAGVAVQLADFVQVVVARLWLGIAPWIGDRRHLSHIVHNLGVPRWAVAPLLAAAATAIALAVRS